MRLPLLLLPLTLTLACGGSAPPGTLLAGEPDSGVPTTGTSTTADAAVEPDAAPVDANEPDAGATDAGLEEECAELGLCCPELEGLAAEACLRAVEGNDPAQCQQALNLAAQAGVCGLDAGPRDGGWPRPDAGAPDAAELDGGGPPDGMPADSQDAGDGLDGGPPPDGGDPQACLDLGACCPELPAGPAQNQCQATAARGRDAACQLALTTAQRGGYCLGDAGP